MDGQIHGLGGSGDAVMDTNLFVFIAIIVILMQLRTRRVRMWSIWILPAFLLLVTAATIAVGYSGTGTLLMAAAGLAIGGAIGVVIGSRMEVNTDERGRMVLKGSSIAVLIWILVLGLKIFGKGIIGDMGLVSLDDLTAALLAMTLGSMIARRAYVLRKYLQMKKLPGQQAEVKK